MYYKKKVVEPHLTAADRVRLANIDNNKHYVNRKFKVELTLQHPKISTKISIMCYGKDKDALKESIAEHVNFFKAHDKKWSIFSLKKYE